MAEAAIDTDFIRERLAFFKGARFKAWLEICAHCGMCADSCFFYTAHDKDPKYTPAYKITQTLGKLYKKNGNVSRAEFEKIADIAYGDCTACRRCTLYCPFGIEPALMIAAVRGMCCSQGLAPPALMEAAKNHLEFGNQMAITTEDMVETCAWMEEENEEEMPGLKIPVDKEGCDTLYVLNAREVKYYPQDIAEAAMIFQAGGENWTFPSMGWDMTNLGMFAGHAKIMAHAAKLCYDAAEKLGCKQIYTSE